MRQIVLDTETTGLSAADGDRIIEIGCVELFNRKLTGRNLHHYINPERDSHEEALRVHGLTTEFLRDKPKFAAIAPELLDYLQGADQLVIHNAGFDISFLNAELARLGLQSVTHYVANVLDTLVMAKEMFPGKRNGLDALCDRLGVDNSGRKLHGALLDAELLADVYINMTRGQDALVMESDSNGATSTTAHEVEAVDFSTLVLPVIGANASEAQAHETVLGDIDKASKGKTLWPRSAVPAA
jgi:DNA polymerase III subunit epsilon